jgi:hypothetical protein
VRLSRFQALWLGAQLALPLLLLGFTLFRRPDLTGPVWDSPLRHGYGVVMAFVLLGTGLQFAIFQVLGRRTGGRPLLIGAASVAPLLACTVPACFLILFLPIVSHFLLGDTGAHDAFRERLEAVNRGEPRRPPERLRFSSPEDLATRAKAYRIPEPLAAPLPEAR